MNRPSNGADDGRRQLGHSFKINCDSSHVTSRVRIKGGVANPSR
jgi:hypothetical protein